MPSQVFYSGFPAALARGGTFDLGDPVATWWLSRLPANPYLTIGAFRLIASVSNNAIDITTITRSASGDAVIWQNRIEGSFQIGSNGTASGTQSISYQAYTSWNSDGSKGAANYQSTTLPSGSITNNIPTGIWDRFFARNSTYQASRFTSSSNILTGTYTTNGDGTGTWSLNDGDSGSFQVTDYRVNNDGSISYRQRFSRSNGSAYGEVQGSVQGNQANNSGQYSGYWILAEKNGNYTFINFRDGALISTGSFQPIVAPTHTIAPSATSINEGQRLTTNIATTGVAAGTALYWSLSGTGINANDFSSGALTGSGTVAANGSLSFAHTLRNDLSTGEGNETLKIDLFTDANRTQRVGNTASVTVLDCSRAPVTYTITPSAKSINEGQTLTTNIATKGVAAGTALYWSLRGTGINANDFSSGALTGSGTVAANGTLSFAHTLRNDLTTEGNESLAIRLFSDANRSRQVGSTATVTVVDSSKASPASPDPITGEIAFSDLGTIVSDRVYGKENYRWLQPIVNNLAFTRQDMDKLTGFNIEFEFNSQYIVATAVVRGDSRQPIVQAMGKDWTARMVLKGDFTYSKGQITSAAIESGAVQLISQASPFSIGSGNIIKLDPKNSTSTVQVVNPSSFTAIRGTTTSASSGFTATDWYFPTANTNRVSEIQDMLQRFGGGRFFYSGWEANPFTPNLI